MSPMLMKLMGRRKADPNSEAMMQLRKSDVKLEGPSKVPDTVTSKTLKMDSNAVFRRKLVAVLERQLGK